MSELSTIFFCCVSCARVGDEATVSVRALCVVICCVSCARVGDESTLSISLGGLSQFPG